jgi:hypothetical protein
MAKQLLVLEEVIGMMKAVEVPAKYIERFREQASAVLAHKNERSLDVEHLPEREPGTDNITVASGFGQKSRKGFVDFTLNDVRSQMPADKAREVGLMLLQASEAAISDEVFVLLMERMGLDTEGAGRMLIGLRELRQGTRGTSWAS